MNKYEIYKETNKDSDSKSVNSSHINYETLLGVSTECEELE